MRKTVIAISFFVVFLIIYFLQANLFPNFTIAGVMPNLFIIFVLFIGLYSNETLGVAFGVIIGLFLDSIYGKSIGITAVMLCIIGFLGAYFDKNFSKDHKVTIILMVACSTFIYELGLYFLQTVLMEFEFEFFQFLRILLIEIVYNILLSILLYPLIQKAGYAIDRTFKKNNLLTRYF